MSNIDENLVQKDLFYYYLESVREHLDHPIENRSEIDQVVRQYFDRVGVDSVVVNFEDKV